MFASKRPDACFEIRDTNGVDSEYSCALRQPFSKCTLKVEAVECSETLTKPCQITESRISQDDNLRSPDTC